MLLVEARGGALGSASGSARPKAARGGTLVGVVPDLAPMLVDRVGHPDVPGVLPDVHENLQHVAEKAEEGGAAGCHSGRPAKELGDATVDAAQVDGPWMA